mmetsp:Transcript_27934/g.94035  ORF Transcript_27934/g.94035 Transcript_27934/m.94035 type:complete len:221 (+) Transcript_27934:2369-3031(+)
MAKLYSAPPRLGPRRRTSPTSTRNCRATKPCTSTSRRPRWPKSSALRKAARFGWPANSAKTTTRRSSLSSCSPISARRAASPSPPFRCAAPPRQAGRHASQSSTTQQTRPRRPPDAVLRGRARWTRPPGRAAIPRVRRWRCCKPRSSPSGLATSLRRRRTLWPLPRRRARWAFRPATPLLLSTAGASTCLWVRSCSTRRLLRVSFFTKKSARAWCLRLWT